MHILQNVWWLLVLIGVMILIHELGHYWAARIFDVRVDAFSFGFGPRLFGFKRGETDFRFSLILFGGYVKMAGEQPGEESTDPRGFLSKPRWQRLIIAFAGPFMNVLLAVGILTGMFMHQFQKVPDSKNPMIGYIVPDSPAAKAGIKEGDRILQIDNTVDPTWEDVRLHELGSANKSMQVAVERDGRRELFTVTPVLDDKVGGGNAGWDDAHEIRIAEVMPDMDAAKSLERGDVVVSVNGKPIWSILKLHEAIRESNGQPVTVAYKRGHDTRVATIQPAKKDDRWMIGVGLEPQFITTQLPFGEALRESVKTNVQSAGLIYKVLQGIVERRVSARTLEGPIRIAQISGEKAREGVLPFVQLMAMVSLNLAIFNLLPIPILDGGVIVLLLIEMVLRRDLSLQFKEAVLKVGFVFLMGLVVFVLYNDISKILG
jgi:regulator of sigma E protease